MKRLFLAPFIIAVLALVLAACGGADEPVAPQIIEKEVVVEKEVIKEVVVEKIVEKEVIQTVVVERIIIATPVEERVSSIAKPVTTGGQLGEGVFGGTLKAVAQASIKSLDADFSNAYVAQVVGVHYIEHLFAWDEGYNIHPQMVDSWDITNGGKTYTFVLRDQQTFSNGDPVTSADVIPSLERWMERHVPGQVLKPFLTSNGLEIVDSRTFRINLNSSFGEVLNSLARERRSGYIWPERIAKLPINEDVGEDNYIGSGPYKVKEWDFGNKVVMERHEGYVPRSEPGSFFAGGQIPYLDEIVWLEIPDEETKIAGLKTGEWHVVDGSSLDQFGDLTRHPDIDVAKYQPGHLSNLFMNHAKAPTDNKLLRQAMLAAIDSEALMSGLGEKELWNLCPAIYFCGTPLESRAAEDLYNQNNPERAKQLLAQSGYNNEPVVLLFPTDYATITPLGLVYKSQMESIGINIDAPTMDWATLVTLIRTPDWNTFTTWCIHSNNADPLVSCLTNTEAGGGLSHWNAPHVDDLKAKYAASLDTAEKLSIVDQLQTIFYDEVPTINVGTFFSIHPYRKEVKGFRISGLHKYANAWLEE